MITFKQLRENAGRNIMLLNMKKKNSKMDPNCVPKEEHLQMQQ